MIFISGDDAACREAQEFIPGIATANVKHPQGRNRAISLPSEKARALIREVAHDSVKLVGKIPPYRIFLPAEITVTFQRTDYCDDAAKKYERIDSRTVRKIIDKIIDYHSLIL